MSSAGCQTNLIDVNFHIQKSLEIFDKIFSWQNLIQKGQGDKSIPLMPIGVKEAIYDIES